ncbi:MAG TPA: RHS repeat-associated core domain-containing protein [Iamia sp.]
MTVEWGAMAPESMSTDTGHEVVFDDWSQSPVYDGTGQIVDWIIDEETPDGLIDRATSSDGRRVDYGYERGFEDLLVLDRVSRPHAVGQPAGTYGTRHYEMVGPRIARIIDEVDATRTEVVVENSYDELGRVTHQVNETGDELDFAYGQKPDPFGVLVDAVGFTTVTNAASGDVTVYEYNDRGEVVAVTDAAGNSVSRSWATDRPESATSREGVDTDHAYDDAGRVVAVTETAGATTRTIETTTYVTPDTSPAARTDDRVATRTDEAGVTTTFTYAGASRDPETMSVPCDPASTDASTPCPPSGLSTTTYTYAAPGLVASVTDPDGVVTEYTYAADRSMATMTTYDGTTPLVTTYTTVRAGDPGWTETNPAAVEVRTTETPGGAVTSEVFDAEGRLVETRDPLYDGTTHLATVYSYRLNGELATVTDPAGGTTTSSVARPGDPGWAEDPEIAEVRTVTGADGVSSISKIDLSGDVVVEQRGDPAVPAELATTTFEYGPLGRLESTTDPMGVTTTYEHDAEGRVTAVVDEDGERTETDHDAFGRVSVETDPLGETRTTTYGPSDRIASVTDRNGEVTSYAYDDAGRVMAVTDARGGVWETTFTRAGRVASETDATDRTTQYRYDTAGRRVEAELPSGDTTTTDYDEDGRVASVTSPEGRVTTATYDDLGRTLTVADPMRGTTVTTYHPTGEVATQTDASGAQVELTYDGAGRVLTVTDPLDRVTTYGYDSRGNRTSRTDARSGVQHWEYDLADRPTKEIDQLGRAAATLTYDDLGRVATRKDGAARTETLTYDEAGQVISSQFGNVPTTYTYDGEGRRTSVTASAGTTTWTYDEVGNVTAIDELGPRDVSWTWDLAGRRVEMTLPNGVRQRNVYDDDGAHAGVERWNGSSWIDSVALTLDDDGLVVGRTVEGGMSATWDRDPSSGRVDAYTEVLGGVTTATDLTHDAVGRVLTETTAAGTTTYGYDAAGQLTGADRPGTADDETFAYDELGRRTTSTQGGTTTTYAWDAASQLTSRTIGGTAHTYTYDGSGRRTLESWNGGASYRQWAWTSRGELGTIKHVTPAGTDETRRYLRGDGRLLSTTTIPATGTQWTTTYAWDTSQGLPRVIGLRTGTNVVTPTYAAGLARVQCNSTSLDCQGPVAHDGLGSAVATPDTDDAITGDEYTAFGDPGAAARGHTLGYRGELHYGGAIHLRARDYDPDTGLFVGPDLLDGVDGTPTVANPYHYADNDPVNKVDPTGLRPTDGYHTTCSVLSVVEGLFGRSGEAIVTDLARSQTNPQRCVPRLEALAECFDSGGDAVDWDQSSYSGGLRCGDWVKDCSAANWKFACDHGAVLVKGGWVVFGASTIVFTVFAGGNPMWAGCGAGAIGGALFAGDDVDEINAAAVGGCITGAAAASGNVAVGCAGGFIGSGVVSTGFDVDPVQGGLGCLYAAGSAAVGTAPTWPFDKPPMFVVSKAWERGIQCALGALSGATSGTDIPDRLLRGLFGCAGGIFLAWKDAS